MCVVAYTFVLICLLKQKPGWYLKDFQMVSFWVASRAPTFRWMMPVTAQEMKNTGFQAPRQYDVLLTGNTSVLGFIIFFNLFASIRRLLCCFFFPFSSIRLWVYCVSNELTYISSAPLLLSDGRIRGDHKQGDTERVSGAFSSSLFSPHSANVQFSLTAWHALVSPSLSPPLSPPL